jgi:hypothetical protein
VSGSLTLWLIEPQEKYHWIVSCGGRSVGKVGSLSFFYKLEVENGHE